MGGPLSSYRCWLRGVRTGRLASMRQTLGEVLGSCVTDVSRAVQEDAADSEATLLDGAPLRVESARVALDLSIGMAPNPAGDGSLLYASPAVPASRKRTTDYRPTACVKVSLRRQPLPRAVQMIVEANNRITQAEMERRHFPSDLGKQKLVAELTDRFGCGWTNLESAFVDDGLCRTLVLVWHANLCSGFISSPALVKFSKSKYAIARAKNLKLATASYYRNYEGPEPGIRDEMEARQVADIRTVLRRGRRAVPSSRSRSLSGQATYATDGTWLFCTAVKPAWDTDLRRLRWKFSAESATVIPDPSSFARELGRVFAGYMQGTHHGSADELKLSYYRQHRFDDVVQVFHGPVLYTDDQELALSQPPHLRGIASCFFKGRSFGWQREYRFVVSMVGEPAGDQLLLPISDNIRDLAETAPLR